MAPRKPASQHPSGNIPARWQATAGAGAGAGCGPSVVDGTLTKPVSPWERLHENRACFFQGLSLEVNKATSFLNTTMTTQTQQCCQDGAKNDSGTLLKLMNCRQRILCTPGPETPWTSRQTDWRKGFGWTLARMGAVPAVGSSQAGLLASAGCWCFCTELQKTDAVSTYTTGHQVQTSLTGGAGVRSSRGDDTAQGRGH